ncbi:MAG TPA: GAF domain-containing protein, partial [Blastocatellia bacterium]|nr:GAF domain-containing protein [Blastocatellia bacterium]
LITSLDSPTPFAAVTRDLAGLVGADSAALWRVEPGTSMIRMIASYGLRSAEFLPLPIGEGLAGTVAKTGEPIILEDAPSDPRCLFPREARESGMIGYLAVPLSNDASSGVVEVHSARPRRWTDDERKTLERAASVIGDVIKGSDSRGNRLRVESSYLGLSEAMQRLRSPEEVKEAAAEVLGHALGVSRAVFVDFGDSGQPEPIKYEYLVATTQPAAGTSLPADLPGRLNERSEGGEPVAISDSRTDSLVGAEAAASLQLLSEMAIPVKIDGKPRGVVYLHQCDRVRDWQREEIDFADRVGRQLSLTLSNLNGLDSATKSRDAAREEARRASEAAGRAQALISALPESVIGLDKEGRVTFFNSTAREFLGLRNEDLGHMAEMTEALSLSDDAIWAGINDAQQVSRFEAELSRPAPVPVSIAVAPVRNKGEIAGKVVVVSNLSHMAGKGAGAAAARISELENRASELQNALDQARAAEAEARATTTRATVTGNTGDLMAQVERLKQDEDRLRRSAQQLLEINRLKSEFIVNAGHELESSVQSVMGFAELLEQGSYGPLTAEQAEAVKGIYAWSRRMKSDIDWLIEYGSTRSRRLDSGEKPENTKPLV